ncbi:type IVB secretion system protein IcmH/DotU [Maricurvus nonylphenolicus]|uniref:type IVB secretion system protein IcmH/DotU n=1 Tax=Maricurvus nonylphenolicus TaxID=1008307 RepID=UPI0036F2FD3D
MSNSSFTPPPAPNAGDRTVMVPTPGAMGSTQAPVAPTPAMQAQFAVPEQIQLQQGLNPLVNSATTLLTVAIKLRTTLNHTNVGDLHKRLIEEIKTFELKAQKANAKPETIISARYLLCTVVDEIVLNTPWGAASGWSQHSLLSLFHQETFGGEKCFVILQRMQENPGNHLDILELYYLCLSLGFEGKYRLAQRGHEQLEQIRDGLYQTIENHRGHIEQDLSPHWQGCGNRKNSMMDYIPIWVVASCVLAVLVLGYSGFRYWLYDATQPMAQELRENISSELPAESGTITRRI